MDAELRHKGKRHLINAQHVIDRVADKHCDSWRVNCDIFQRGVEVIDGEDPVLEVLRRRKLLKVTCATGRISEVSFGLSQQVTT